MAKRKAISKEIRFEVFKRDKFTCQYCGRKAPDVVLNADHINPVSKGGGNELLNLITSCFDCNNGKRDKKLDDNSIIEKQRRQLELLQERREQMELMIEWKKSLSNLADDTINLIIDYIENKISPYSVSESGKKNVEKWIKDFSINEILDAIDESARAYLKYNGEDLTKDSVEVFFSKISGIIVVKNMPPIKKKIAYIKGIARNRFGYWDDKKGAIIMNNYVEALKKYGWTETQIIDDLETEVITKTKEAKNWSEWRSIIEGWTEDIGKWEKSESKNDKVELSVEQIESYAYHDIASTKNKIEVLIYLGKSFPNFDDKAEENLKIDIFHLIYDFLCRQEELYLKECNIANVDTVLDDFTLDNPLDKYFALPDDYVDNLKPLSWSALFCIYEKSDFLIRDILSDYYYAETLYSQSSINATLKYLKNYYLDYLPF